MAGADRELPFGTTVPHGVGDNNSHGVSTEPKSIGMILVAEILGDAPAVRSRGMCMDQRTL